MIVVGREAESFTFYFIEKCKTLHIFFGASAWLKIQYSPLNISKPRICDNRRVRIEPLSLYRPITAIKWVSPARAVLVELKGKWVKVEPPSHPVRFTEPMLLVRPKICAHAHVTAFGDRIVHFSFQIKDGLLLFMTKSYYANFGLTLEWAISWVLSELQFDCKAQTRGLNIVRNLHSCCICNS